MRVKKITVNKLFGIFDHEISLNMSDRITILHGKNGVGKTSLLRLINGFFNLKYSELFLIPFEKLTILFDNQHNLVIQHKEYELEKSLAFLFLNQHNTVKENFDFKYNQRYKETKSSKRLSNAIRTGIAMKNAEIGTTISSNNSILNIDKIYRFDMGKFFSRELQKQQPEWLKEIRDSIYVKFIESQRLLNIADNASSTNDIQQKIKLSSVEMYSEDLAKNIQNKLKEYGKLSQSLDRNFISRVFETSSITLTDDELKAKLNELENKRHSLINAGLLNKDENPNFQIKNHIDDSTRKLLSIYVEDIEKKINIFEEITTKIELFKRIINQKFSYKKITIDQEKGFTFINENGQNLSPTDLSSGEQHELVMLYELLFKVKPNSLILIDEPELSLHMEWKIQFLKDLEEITKLANIDIIIATHSASLINDRWDLTVELKR